LTLETQEAELAKLVEFLQVCGLHQEEFRNKLDTFKRSATANATLEHFIVDLKRPLYEELSEADILSYLKKNQPILKAAAAADSRDLWTGYVRWP